MRSAEFPRVCTLARNPVSLVNSAHADLREFGRRARLVVDKIPAKSRPGSPRRSDTDQLRGSRDGGGRERADLLDRLNVDAQVMAANLTLILEAVADCIEIASGRDNAVNGPGLSFAVRPGMEVAGQIAWLLDDSLDGTQRARRYLVWRFHDLRQQRLLIDDFRSDNSVAEAVQELDEVEQRLLADVRAARWQARPTVLTPKGVTTAVLLDEDGKTETMPRINELVRLVARTRSVHPLLSIPTHGVRFGVHYGLEVDDEAASTGSRQARLAGFSIDTNLLIGLAIVAVDRSTMLLGGWNGVSGAEVHSWSLELMRRAGIA